MPQRYISEKKLVGERGKIEVRVFNRRGSVIIYKLLTLMPNFVLYHKEFIL